MGDPVARLRQFLAELKRRKVYRTAVVYGVVAFAVWQVADYLFPALNFPAWTVDFVVVLSLLGFPLALVLAWAFDLTPEGVRRTVGAGEAKTEAAPSGPGPSAPGTGWTGSRMAAMGLVALGLLSAAFAGGWYLMAGGGEPEADAGPAERSIAVLPFDALSPGDDSETFARGIHDDLLTKLFNVSELTVISRTAVEKYRGTDLTTGQIADSLGVRWVMEGGVEILGDEIQVNAQLIDPRTETHAWADSYRRELTAESLFDLQSEITRRIARSMEAELTPAEAERIERRPTGDLEAYRLYVQGRGLLDQREPETVAESVHYFQRALRQDSSYALAWSGLADAMMLEGFFDVRMPSDAPGAAEAARRALELDPDLPEGHASLGIVLAEAMRGPAALRELQRAVELKPSYAQAQHWLGVVLLVLGQKESALEPLRRAVELNPRHGSAPVWLASAYLANGQVERGLRTARRHRATETDLDAWARALLRLERFDEARRLARRPPSCCEESLFTLAMIDVAAGDTATARDRLEQMREGASRPVAVGLVEAAMGRLDAGFESLEEAELHETSWTGWTLRIRYQYPELLAAFRRDPRFDELLRDLNVAWGLNPDGSLPDSVDVVLERDD